MLFEIEHTTEYRYTELVRLDEHLLRLTPRSVPWQRVLHQEIEVTPRPTDRRSGIDAEDNIVEWLDFGDPTSSLRIVNTLTVETTPPITLDLLRPAPLRPEEIEGLAPYLTREFESQEVDNFASLHWTTTHTPMEFVDNLNRTFLFEFVQVIRETGGPMKPEETLKARNGACRDFAVLMIDAYRSVGVPARFVSGYQQGDIDITHRHLHAWVEVYLGHVGWVGFDPTLGTIAGEGHIALAAAATPENAAPVYGTFWSVQATSTLESNLSLSAIPT